MWEFFLKIRKLLKLGVFISSSKFIMTIRLLNIKRGKKPNAPLSCICDGFLREEGLVHQKVHDARVNVVDPLAPGSASKEMLIFNLVSRYAYIPDKQNYLKEVAK